MVDHPQHAPWGDRKARDLVRRVGEFLMPGHTFTIVTNTPDLSRGVVSVDVCTVEFRQRLGRSFGVAAFADAGQVAAGSGLHELRLLGEAAQIRIVTVLDGVMGAAVELGGDPRKLLRAFAVWMRGPARRRTRAG